MDDVLRVLGEIGQGLLTAALPALGTVIAGMVVAVLKRFLKQQKLDITEAQEEQLKRIVEDAVKAVEEMARRDGKMTSLEKSTMAKQIILEQSPRDIPIEKLQVAVDAALPTMRAELKGESR